eukprot:scaffold68080_cov51-Attheya_sp.AAC.5
MYAEEEPIYVVPVDVVVDTTGIGAADGNHKYENKLISAPSGRQAQFDTLTLRLAENCKGRPRSLRCVG